jgi:phosphoribosylformylglycinamidine cyclo-ligase
MPDVYAEGEFDMVGFAVGVVSLRRAVDPTRVEQGDIIIGLASDGVHSNGFSLVRAIIKERRLQLDNTYAELGNQTLGETLLTPTRIYAKPIVKLLSRYKVKRIVSGMAHITGGGLPGNVVRVLPDDLDAVIDTSAWAVPPIFDFLQAHGKIDRDEMLRVFNMGVGFVLIVRPTFADSVIRQLNRQGERAFIMGKVVKGNGEVRLD